MEEKRKAIFALTSRSRRAHVTLTSSSSRAHVALKSRSNTPKIGERILGAPTALTSRSNGENRDQMGEIALMARHERTMIALFL